MENNRIKNSIKLLCEWRAKLEANKDSQLARILESKINELEINIQNGKRRK